MKKFIVIAALLCAAPVMAADIMWSGDFDVEAVGADGVMMFKDVSDSSALVRWVADLGLKVEAADNVTFVGLLRAGNDNADSVTTSNVAMVEAYMELREVLDPSLTLRAGLQPVEYALRKGGSAFILSSEGDDTAYANGTPSFLGYLLSVDMDNLNVDVFSFTDTENAASLSGLGAIDRSLLGVNVDYWLDERNLITGMLLIDRDHTTNALGTTEGTDELQTVAIGVDYFLNDQIEIYGNLGMNMGKDTSLPAGAELTYSGMGLQVGCKYVLGGEQNIWFQGQIDYLSGDKDSADDKYEGFLNPYNTIDDLLLLESAVAPGLGSDPWGTMGVIYGDSAIATAASNMMLIKLSAGMTPQEGLDVCATIGLGQTNVKTENYSVDLTALGGPLIVGDIDKVDLGTEIDIKATYAYSEDLDITATLAYLMPGEGLSERMLGAGVDLIEESMVALVVGAALDF